MSDQRADDAHLSQVINFEERIEYNATVQILMWATMGENGSLSTRQKRALGALLTEKDVRAASLKAGVGETTLFRWLTQPGFKVALRKAQSQVFESAIASLKSATAEAVETLRQVLNDESAKPSERVASARAILEFSFRAKELIELDDRLRVIENALAPSEQQAR